jgi:hypothetical protein
MSSTHAQITEAAIFMQGIPEGMLTDVTFTFGYDGKATLSVWTDEPRKYRAAFREAGVRGRWEKKYSDYNADYVVKTVSGLKVMISTSRLNVCKQVEIGTETVEVPDYSAVPKKTIERPITKWECK